MNQEMFYRGGVLNRWIVRPEGNATWNADDWARAATLEARWKAAGVCEEERKRLLPCAILKRKWSGTVFETLVESRLRELLQRGR